MRAWLSALVILAACGRKEEPKTSAPAAPPTHIGPVPSPALIDRAREQINKLPQREYPDDKD